MLYQTYVFCIVTLNLKVIRLKLFIFEIQKLITLYECRLAYYETRLKGMKNESEIDQIEKIAS